MPDYLGKTESSDLVTQDAKLFFWALIVFSIIMEFFSIWIWHSIYGLLVFDEQKNLVNTSKTEMFFHGVILFNLVVILILKIVVAAWSVFADADIKSGLQPKEARTKMIQFWQLN
jgi:hypothetical protein